MLNLIGANFKVEMFVPDVTRFIPSHCFRCKLMLGVCPEVSSSLDLSNWQLRVDDSSSLASLTLSPLVRLLAAIWETILC